MKYRLVLQIPSSSLEDYELLLSLEETLEKGLGELGIVDGHDTGSGEMNIFIHTNQPKLAFERSLFLLRPRDELRELKAGYRDFDENVYHPIYPEGLNHFSVS